MTDDEAEALEVERAVAALCLDLPVAVMDGVTAQLEGGRDVLDVLILLADLHLADEETQRDILELIFECSEDFESSPEALAVARVIRERTARARWRSRSGADAPERN